MEYTLATLVLRVALDGAEAQVLDELATEVGDDHLGGPDLRGLGAHGVPVLLLPNVSQEADHLVALVQEPSQYAAGVKATWERNQLY